MMVNEPQAASGQQGPEDGRGNEKLRWIDMFDRGSHRQFHLEYLRDRKYDDIIVTLRRSLSAQEGRDTSVSDGEDSEQTTVHSAAPFHIHIPPEQYFLTPDPTMHTYFGRLFPPGLAGGIGGIRGGASSGAFSSTESESSFGPSTMTTSLPASSRKWLPPEAVAEKERLRRRRTAVCVCFAILAMAVVSLAVGVILHFLLETGSLGGAGHQAALADINVPVVVLNVSSTGSAASAASTAVAAAAATVSTAVRSAVVEAAPL